MIYGLLCDTYRILNETLYLYKTTMKKLIIILTILAFPISLVYWLAWSLIELIKIETDHSPLNIKE